MGLSNVPSFKCTLYIYQHHHLSDGLTKQQATTSLVPISHLLSILPILQPPIRLPTMGVFTMRALVASTFLFTMALARPLSEAIEDRDISIGITIGAGGNSSPPPLPLQDIAASNTGSAALPAPTGPPKYVLLGIGYQNYSCSGGSYVQSTPGTGAIANLYDITSSLTASNVNTISPSALRQFESCLAATGCTPKGDSYCPTCHQLAIAATVPLALSRKGLHFFDRPATSNVPNFDVFAYGDFLSAKKAGDVKAPPGSYGGSTGNSTVDWLYLVDNGSGRTHGLSSVYRVETAGGTAPKTCATEGTLLSVPYTAQYWFQA